MLQTIARKMQTGREKAGLIAREEGVIAGTLAIIAEGLSVLGIQALNRYGWPAVTIRWDNAFDRNLAFETTTIHDVSALGFTSEQAATAHWYEATSMLEFRMVMSMLEINPTDFLFVDYGSGKGRVMLMAAQHPFAMVRGVEASGQLHEAAKQNIASFPASELSCQDVVPVLADATTWAPDRKPFIAFFFNPFFGKTLQSTLENIIHAAASSQQPCYIVYVNPTCRDMFEDVGSLVLEKSAFGEYILLFRIDPETR